MIRLSFSQNDSTSNVEVISMNKHSYQLKISEKELEITPIEVNQYFVSFFLRKKKIDAFISSNKKGDFYISIKGNIYKLRRNDVLDNTETTSSGILGESANNLFAPMPGKVLVINVKEGEKVNRGTVLVVVEAMKMENNIVAGSDAIVEKINVSEGEMVDTDKQLVKLKKIKN